MSMMHPPASLFFLPLPSSLYASAERTVVGCFLPSLPALPCSPFALIWYSTVYILYHGPPHLEIAPSNKTRRLGLNDILSITSP
jgi:hypothetical protein